jgi:hypothetical protein
LPGPGCNGIPDGNPGEAVGEAVGEAEGVDDGDGEACAIGVGEALDTIGPCGVQAVASISAPTNPAADAGSTFNFFARRFNAARLNPLRLEHRSFGG